MPVRVVVLLSGSGTTLQNLIDRVARGELDARITGVVSSRAGVYGLERARLAGIPAATVPRRDYAGDTAFNADLWREIRGMGADLVVLAGFMSLIAVPEDFHNRILNVHPALIPAFCGHKMYGHHVHEAVLAFGAKVSGATVHFVDDQYDHGPVILQKAVPVLDGDTPDTLAERVQAAEREIYPQAVQLFAEGRLVVEGRRVRVR